MADPESRSEIERTAAERTRRHRRWAYGLMLLLTALLLLNVHMRKGLPLYGEPQVFSLGDTVVVVVDEHLPTIDGITSTLHRLTAELEEVGTDALSTARVRIVPLDDALLVFSEHGCSVQRNGKTERTVRLNIRWSVRQVLLLPDEETLQLIGQDPPVEGRRGIRFGSLAISDLLTGSGGEVSVKEDPRVSGSTPKCVELLDAERVGDITYVAWVNPKTNRLTLHNGEDGTSEGFDSVDRFALAQSDGNLLIVYLRWRLEKFGTMTLRTLWLAPDGTWVAGQVDIPDRRVIGRRVNYIAAAPVDGGVAVALSRTSSLQVVGLDVDHGSPTVKTPLKSLTGHPTWLLLATTLLTPILLFCSIALIYFGVAIYREKRRLIARILKIQKFISPYAGSIERGFAYVIDILLLMPFVMIGWEYLGVNSQTATTGWFTWDTWALTLPLIIAQFAYFFLLELAWGQTIGKFILGIRVRSAGGGRARLVSVLIRNLLRLVDATTCTWPIGLAFILLTGRKQRLGDLLGKTIVVPVESVRTLDAEAEPRGSEPDAGSKTPPAA